MCALWYLQNHTALSPSPFVFSSKSHDSDISSCCCSVTQSCPTLCSPKQQPLQYARLPYPSPTTGACSNSCPSSWWGYLASLSSVTSFSFCLQYLPVWGSFQMSRLFTSGGQSIGVSALASVLPMNIQDWSPLGWTGWISLQSKGLSRGLTNTTVQKHQFFSAQFSYGSTPTSIHDYWKNHGFDYMDFCSQSNVSAS